MKSIEFYSREVSFSPLFSFKREKSDNQKILIIEEINHSSRSITKRILLFKNEKFAQIAKSRYSIGKTFDCGVLIEISRLEISDPCFLSEEMCFT